MRTQRRQFALVALAIGGLATVALAHSGASGIVKQRMDQMEDIGKATKAIGQMLGGKTAWDPDAARELASKIAEGGGSTLTALFPKDSIKGPSEAKPEIWSDWDRFTGIADDLQAKAKALSDGAGNARDDSPQAPEALFAAMAGTCKACHRDFRVKK